MYTEGYEGFFHLDQMAGDVESAHLEYIIRDHDRKAFEKKKALFEEVSRYLNVKYGEGTVLTAVKDSYYNMKEQIEPDHLYLIDTAKEAMKSLDIKPLVSPIRGGTDGVSPTWDFPARTCPPEATTSTADMNLFLSNPWSRW